MKATRSSITLVPQCPLPERIAWKPPSAPSSSMEPRDRGGLDRTRRCRGRVRRAVIACAVDLEAMDRLGTSLHLDVAEVDVVDVGEERLERPLAHRDVVALRDVAGGEARGHVHRIADDGVLETALRAEEPR